jgi:ribonuclease inhibitor
MSQVITLDFKGIHTYHQFYNQCKKQFDLPEYFGHNLDALWDMLTTELPLPVVVQCIHLTPFHQQKFASQLALFKEAANELGAAFIYIQMDSEDGDMG